MYVEKEKTEFDEFLGDRISMDGRKIQLEIDSNCIWGLSKCINRVDKQAEFVDQILNVETPKLAVSMMSWIPGRTRLARKFLQMIRPVQSTIEVLEEDAVVKGILDMNIKGIDRCWAVLIEPTMMLVSNCVRNSKSFALFCLEGTRLLDVVCEKVLPSPSDKQWFAALTLSQAFVTNPDRRRQDTFMSDN